MLYVPDYVWSLVILSQAGLPSPLGGPLIIIILAVAHLAHEREYSGATSLAKTADYSMLKTSSFHRPAARGLQLRPDVVKCPLTKDDPAFNRDGTAYGTE